MAPFRVMDAAVALASLEKAGTEQNRKTYRRFGAPDPLFGVSYAVLNKLAKQIKIDHDLAMTLWASGNTDARVLAAKVADPTRLDAETALRWVVECRYMGLVDEIAGVVARSPIAMTCMAEWVGSDDEWIGRAGWTVMGRLARNPDVPDASFTPYIAVIERRIHEAKNWTRDSMNRALIAIGSRSSELAEIAIAAARRIGPVEVDVGDTDCLIPDAELYIKKTRAYAAEKARTGSAKAARMKVAGRPVTRVAKAKAAKAAKAARAAAKTTAKRGSNGAPKKKSTAAAAKPKARAKKRR